MKRFGSAIDANKMGNFQDGYQKIFDKVYPNLDIGSDKALDSDEELSALFRALETTHTECLAVARNIRRGRNLAGR